MRRCLITDRSRGIYVGDIDYVEYSRQPTAWITIFSARHVYSYVCFGGTERGLFSLATVGPGPGSKIGPVVEECLLLDVGLVIPLSDSACDAFAMTSWAG